MIVSHAAPVQSLNLPNVVPPTLAQPALPPQIQAPPASGGGFAQLLTDGINRVDADMTRADQMVRAFTLDDSVPVHQVTFALEQARLSLELALQVRSRLVDGYQQLMNMQL